ncbi:asparagine synthase (glutamine-hydrolyzing) [Catalinimonas niigatensis]|uniref:asparagine synthase (glutamine-hydrolyzing) n=1 Tax=Catalinimonas niigatensis TaxID=1397264 RepID=UPI002665103F|nr:asparagine synthase (glutamine-hydrolyzing) [Catalinimonas niigatensis]WPP52896.1 asparagine synthase (glutamine-hydrolyzing) [Catalinimonas niigatensis]
MCGIIGQISFDGLKHSSPQLDLLHHRGPDDKGEWTSLSGNVYLGHTRLAILEPTEAGKQPMNDVSKRFTISFNGEIYNHLELRTLLPAINWKGNSDTETLVELLSDRGLDALNLLKGMFAFSLYDSKDNSILLVRDRLGIKPLWYRYHGKRFIFSSEIRALLKPGESKLTEQALSEYIGFGRMPGIGAIFEGVEALPPGSWVKINESEGITKGNWWPNSSFTIPKPKNRLECTQKVKQLVTRAIEEHLISDVGVGAFLSGGIDSSIVTLMAGKVLGRRLQTFTIGFPQKTFDERAIARKVAIKAGSEHTELEVSSDTCLDWVKEAVLNLDLPSVDAINTYIVSRAVRDTGLKVALSGLGGDELFGGYPSFQNIPWLHLLNVLPSTVSRKLVTLVPKNIKEKLGGLTDFTSINLTSARRRFTSIDRLRAMGLEVGTPVIPSPPSNLDMMGMISWTEIHAYMIPMLLRDSDQMSMAVGLEIRVPFLDHHLVEEVLGLSQKYKKGSGIKPLLIAAFQPDLPREVYDRPKQGFTLPMDEWIRGPLAEFSNEGVLAAADLLSMSEPMQQIESFHKGNLHWTRIWKWCVLGHWLAKRKECIKFNL